MVGLGNPGRKYHGTRHNLGFEVVAELARRRGQRFDRRECESLVAGDGELLLAQPQTFMNRSGYAVRCLAELHDLEPAGVLVVFDDIHLELGRLRLRPAGGPGGHRGMESVIHNLRSDQVPRLRLGILPAIDPPPAADLADFVLGPFFESERELAVRMVERAADACEAWLHGDLATAMNRFNADPPCLSPPEV